MLALVAVLLVMGYAFWRAAAGRGTTEASKVNQATAEGAEPPNAPPAATGGASPDPATGAAGHASPVAAPPPQKHPSATTAPAAAEPDEGQLMARLRAIKDSDPAAAVPLAREGNRRFPDSADAPERTSILIHALVATDKGSEARGEAEHMVNHYPDSTWVREVERFTGAHRHRSVGVNDAGQLIFR